MPRLDTLTLLVTHGESPAPSGVRYEINGFEVDFDEISGGTAPRETLKLVGSPSSFPHSLALLGPDEGEWKIDRLSATYESGGESYTINLGAITLDTETKLDLKYDRPKALLDV